MVKLYIY